MRRVFILLALLLLATSARAEDKGKAREAFRVGTQHFKLGEYEQALDSFKEADHDVYCFSEDGLIFHYY